MFAIINGCGDDIGAWNESEGKVMPSNEKKASNINPIVDVELEAGFDKRVLMSLVFDVTQLSDNVERIKIQVMTLAKHHGIKETR